MIVSQSLGAAVSVSASQAILRSRLIASLRINAPDVNLVRVLTAGASELSTRFGEIERSGIVVAYVGGLEAALVLCIVMTVFAGLISLFMPWKSVRKADAPSSRHGQDQGRA